MRGTVIKFILSVVFLLQFNYYAQGQNSRAPKVKDFAAYLATHGQDPVDYVIDKFRDHYVVALGEDHWIKDHPLFLCDLLRKINDRKDSIKVDILALEFGNVTDQKLADEFIASPTYRQDLVIKILQHSADTYGWPYLEAVQIFKTVWENNQGKDKAHRTRILLLDPPYMMQLMNNEKYEYTGSRDESMVSIIRSHIPTKKRILLYAGLLHTRKTVYGSYLQPYNIYYNQTSAGFLLKSLYPQLVFIVKLWGGLIGSNGYNPVAEPIKWERLYNGKIDEAFKLNGNKPVAFDINNSPFSKIPVAEFYNTSKEALRRSKDRFVGCPYNENILLKDDADGIIFFKPVEEFSGATVCGEFFDDDFVKLIEKRTDGEVKTRKEVFEYMKEQHPILANSLNKLIEKEGQR